MGDNEESNLLLREIRDLLTGHEKRYVDYLARVEAEAKANRQNHSEHLAKQEQMYKMHLEDVRLERKRGRVGLFLIALVIGLFLWAFMMWVIVRVQ
jgi:hypothetical protein